MTCTEEWSTRQVAGAAKITTTRAINYATRWGVTVDSHGPGSRAAWSARDVATFHTLLRVQEAFGELRASVAAQIVSTMRTCKWGAQTFAVKLNNTVTVTIEPVWTIEEAAAAAAA